MYDPESRYKVRKYLERHGDLVSQRTYYCRCRTQWGAGNMKTPHHVSVVNDVLEHRTACTHSGHLKDIKQLFYRERHREIGEKQVYKDRQKNSSYWRQMRAAANKKYQLYAKNNCVDIETARFEVAVCEELDRAERDAIWEEAALYIPRSSREEE